MAKSINLDSTSKGLNNILNEMNATNVKIGETINDTAYDSAANTLLNSVNDLNTEIDSAMTNMDSKITNMDNSIGDLSNLFTEDKDSLVDAINELFQNANSGKQLIASAIGVEEINEDSTFKAMSEAIETLKSAGVNNEDIKQIECGSFHSVVLLNNGDVYNCGRNNYGQLGNSSSGNVIKLTKVFSDAKQIACGYYHTIIVKNDGTLWVTGRNSNGQLGLGNTTDQTAFVQVPNMNNVKQVACGEIHTMVVKKDGTLWGAGYNYYGGLGLGTTSTSQSTFVQVPDMNDVNYVVCNYSHSSYAIKNDGTLWTTGRNQSGQLGIGNYEHQSTFVQATDSVKYMDCGLAHAMILKQDGTVWTCGTAENGQLGNISVSSASTFTQLSYVTASKKAINVFCGRRYSFVVYEDGSVAACGDNTYRQLQFPSGIKLDLFAETKSWSFYEDPYYGKVTITTSLFQPSTTYSIVNNGEGLFKLYLLDASGNILMDKDVDTVGVTEIETPQDTITSVELHFYEDNGWYCYSEEDFEDYYEYINFYEGEYLGSAVSVFEDTILSDIKSIGTGEYHTLFLTNNGSLYSSGINGNGQLGTNDTDNREVLACVMESLPGGSKELLYNTLAERGFDVNEDMMTVELINELEEKLEEANINFKDIKQIACGEKFTFVLKTDGSLYSTGYNNNGQLGLFTTTNISTFEQVIENINNDVKAIACGYDHVIILKNDGTIWGAGNNQYSQLGMSSSTTFFTRFTQITENINSDVEQIACGKYHTMIIKTDGSLWATGYNGSGQLGTNDTDSRYRFTQIIANVSNDVKQVACGNEHTLIIKNDNSLWGTGRNLNGQLGINNTSDQSVFVKATEDVKYVSCCYYHSAIIKNDNKLYTCGRNNMAQIGFSDYDQRLVFTDVGVGNVKQVSCGAEFTAVLKKDGSVWTCGSNYNGQLGLGNQTDVTAFTQTSATNVRQVACGHYHTFIVTNDDTIKCSGYNDYGQLGNGLSTSSVYTSFTDVTTIPTTSSGNEFSKAWLGEQPMYFVSDIEGATYGFDYDGSTYYVSNNAGVSESAALCRLYIHNPTSQGAYLYCINYAESNYDYGLISNKNTALNLTYTADSEDSCLQSFKNSHSSSEQTVTLPSGSGWYYIKYRKDSSSNENNDSLKFRVAFE